VTNPRKPVRPASQDRLAQAVGRRELLSLSASIGAGLALGGSWVGPAFAQAKPIKVGVLAPMSGVYASLGAAMVNGIRMFLDQQGGKVAGRAIEITVEDDEANPQVGLRKARKLVEEEQVDVLLGVISSAIGYALKDYVARAQKVWVTTGAAADGIFKKKNNNPYAFRASLSTWQANNPMGTWIAKKGHKRVFVTGPDYAMGREANEAFHATFKVDGGQKVGEAYAPLGTSDYAPYLAEIKKASPDLVYASYSGVDAVRFVQQYAKFGLKETIPLSGYGYLVEEDLLGTQGEAALGVASCLNWGYGLDTPQNKSFVAEYRKRFNAIPTVDSVAGYVGIQVIHEALKSLDGKIPDQLALSGAIVKVKLETPRGPISFDPETNNVIQNIYIREVAKDGAEEHNRILVTYENVKDPGV
jgi:branched-chain amino acid transport system substrate-binding protein